MKYQFIEPFWDYDESMPVIHTVSRRWIELMYYPYWAKAAKEKGIQSPENLLEKCIDDFVVVHWASEVEDDWPTATNEDIW